MHVNLLSVIQTIGYLGVFAVVFAESGLFFGFFLPGDSLLFTAGILAAGGHFNLVALLVVVMVGAVLGDSFGYYFGHKTGEMLFKRKDSQFFKQEHLTRTSLFYEKHGSKTLIMARFIPVVRTFAPILAGASKMRYRKFFLWNALGGILWTLLLTILGYFLGRKIPSIDHYLLPIVFAIIFVSLIPAFWNMYREKRSK